MKAHQNLVDLLNQSLEASRLTQDPSTYRGRRTSVNLLNRAFQRASHINLEDLEDSTFSVAHFIQALQEEIRANEQGKAYTTLSQQLSQICKVLEEIAHPAPQRR